MRLVVLLMLATTSGALAQPAPAPSAQATTNRFDGTWSVTLTCADFKDAGVGAKGYTFRFLAEVKNGLLEAQHGKVGAPGSLHYSGRLQADGTGEIQANGFTGDPAYSVDRVATSTPYAYRAKATFDVRQGSAKRLDLRPCEATFTKQ